MTLFIFVSPESNVTPGKGLPFESKWMVETEVMSESSGEFVQLHIASFDPVSLGK